MDPEIVTLIVDGVSWVLIGIGSIFLVIGGVGLLRLPDMYTRMHAAGITDTMGAGMLVAGLIVQGGFSLVTVKLVLILVFIFFTSPTATHAVAKAALSSRLKPVLDRRGGKSSK